MAERGRQPHSRGGSFGEGNGLSTRSLENFGRKVTATAGHFIGDGAMTQHYHSALGEIHRELRHPLLQRNVFALSQTSPRELVRSKLSTTEIQHRALTYLPNELLHNIPENHSPFSLFQGFQATLPESDKGRRRHGRHGSKTQKLLDEKADDPNAPLPMKKLRNEKQSLDHRLDMMEVRKHLCSTEIREIDNKITNLNTMRKIVLDRLADLETEEGDLEHEMLDIEGQMDELQEELDDEAALSGSGAAGQKTPTTTNDISTQQSPTNESDNPPDSPGMEASFMSESIYQKLPSPKSTKRPKHNRRRTNYILHEHLAAGSQIRSMPAHNDTISALDFDVPFGTMVTAALDDTVRVWDLSAGRCMGLLEGHLSSVRCLQVEDNIVATGSMDATVRLWDLSQADYTPPPPSRSRDRRKSRRDDEDEPAHAGSDEEDFADASEAPASVPPSSMRDCPLLTLSAHVAEITALHMYGKTLVSGSADKTLRQWDMEKGRCVQTLDVLWAAAQASTLSGPSGTGSSAAANGEPQGFYRHAGRAAPDTSGDFVGAVQCFDAALACGTADGLVRLWDLRSGQVHRSLVGHTGPVTCLQFDDVHLVTGSADRSVRIWDLRTGSIFDAYAYDQPVSSVMFDSKSIVAAAGEDVVKVYDKLEGKHWDCGESQEGGAGGSIVEHVRIKDGYMLGGRKDGVVAAWSV